MERLRAWAVSIVCVAAVSVGGCRSQDVAERTTAALRETIQGKPISPATGAVWKTVREFYQQRQGAPVWVSNNSTGNVETAIQEIDKAAAHGFAPADYGEPTIVQLRDAIEKSEKNAADRPRRLAELDVRATTALLAVGRDVTVGRTTPTAIEQRWKARRAQPDFLRALNAAVTSGISGWLESLRPRDPQYAALQHALADLRGQRDKGGWPPVPPTKFKLGESDHAVITLRHRLAAEGYLSGAAATNESTVYDDDVQNGVKAFQDLHALKPTGIADAATLTAMNVPIDERIRQVVLNLERWRWMPDDLASPHLMVNIPSYHLMVRDDAKVTKDIRVVVGKSDPAHQTPIFSGKMTTVVFSPYWNIPDTIVEGETAPAIVRDPGYLEKNGIEILRVSKSGTTQVDPSSVDWGNEAELKQLAFRQRPGAHNALGHVKFLFPNPFDVYLHDTPADALFSRPGRAFSHGCVRVEEPEALAKYVLRDDPEWDDARILEAMHAGVEKQVKLNTNLPVHIVYFTAWVDDRGGLHYYPDVYGYDAKQATSKA